MRPCEARWTKKQKWMLRELNSLAHTRDLEQELEKLEEKFKEWREGKIHAFDLNHAIHVHHQGPSRELFKRYNNKMNDINVLYAFEDGLIEEDEIPDEVADIIYGHPLRET
jgi:hypothetical protein